MSVTLKSSDGKSYVISAEAAKLSRYLQTFTFSGKNEIPLEDTKAEIVKPLAEYLQYYADKDFPQIPEIITGNDISKLLSPYDLQFINSISFEQAFHLINVANSLDLEHLHDLACFKIAAFIKGRTPEEVNREFTIECQLTQDEAKQLGLEPS